MYGSKRGKPLSGEDEDVYEGFNEYNAALLEADDLVGDVEWDRSMLKTSAGRKVAPMSRAGGYSGPPSTSYGKGKGRIVTSYGRQADPSSKAAPLRPASKAGYKAPPPTSYGGRAPASPLATGPPLEKKTEDTPEAKIKELERKVNELIEDSCVLAHEKHEKTAGLSKAKEAARLERQLMKQAAQLSGGHQEQLTSFDLTFLVLFNLACHYEYSEMYREALNTYEVIMKNKVLHAAGRINVSMGNVYYKQGNYTKALKLYRMAFDKIPQHHKHLRVRVMENMAVVFITLGEYAQAAASFEHIMQEEPNFKTSLNLILCYNLKPDTDKMKNAFERMLQIQLKYEDDEDKYCYTPLIEDNLQAQMLLEAIRNDSLRQIEKEIKRNAERCVLIATKLMGPVIGHTFSEGYDWCVDAVRGSPYMQMANDLEIAKALVYLRAKDFQAAVETLKTFEKRDTQLASSAAVNLAFVYFQSGDIANANKYADLAIKADKYNAFALVNKGNCYFMEKDYVKAMATYRDALASESSCVEAMFNLGLVCKKMKKFAEAQECYFKLHQMIKNHPQVLYQIGDIYALDDEVDQALEWFTKVLGIAPTDPSVLRRVGEIYDSENDHGKAFQYYSDSFRYFPSNLPVIEWLGAYYVTANLTEKAVQYFERAAIIQPQQVKWQLMVATCYRRSGNYKKALNAYKTIHKKFPDNVDCLKFLIRICHDLGMKEVHEYTEKLKKAELKKQRDEMMTKEKRPETASSISEAKKPSSAKKKPPSEPAKDKFAKQVFSEPVQYEPRAQDIDTGYDDPLANETNLPQKTPIPAGGGVGAHQATHEFNDVDDDSVLSELLPD